MEKFFTIKKDSAFYEAYVQYEKDVKANAEAFKKFSEEHGIEATLYVPSASFVMIIPTENDLKKFEGMCDRETCTRRRKAGLVSTSGVAGEERIIP